MSLLDPNAVNYGIRPHHKGMLADVYTYGGDLLEGKSGIIEDKRYRTQTVFLKENDGSTVLTGKKNLLGPCKVVDSSGNVIGVIKKKGFSLGKQFIMNNADGELVLTAKGSRKGPLEISDEVGNTIGRISFGKSSTMDFRSDYHPDWIARNWDLNINDHSSNRIVLLAFFLAVYVIIGAGNTVIDYSKIGEALSEI